MPVSSADARPDDHGQVAADETISIRLLDIPLVRVKDPRARAYIVDHLKPGTTIHRRVEVRNASRERQRIDLYSAGASIEGNVFTGSAGRTGNELSGWVSTDASHIDLPAGAKASVKVTIAVPESASQGERYAAVWAEVARPPTNGGNIGQIRRVGVRIYLDVGPGGEPPTDFRISGLAVAPGPGEWPMITAQVQNTGQRALDLAGTLSLSRESGTARAGPFSVQTGVTILPGESGQVRAELTESLPGRWNAQLVLVSGTVERKAEGKITLPGPVIADMMEPSGGRRILIPLGIVVGVIVIAVVMFAYRSRKVR